MKFPHCALNATQNYLFPDLMLGSIIASIVIPNVLFVISITVLLYWYCPYCQAKCQSYEEQIDQEEYDAEPE